MVPKSESDDHVDDGPCNCSPEVRVMVDGDLAVIHKQMKIVTQDGRIEFSTLILKPAKL